MPSIFGELFFEKFFSAFLHSSTVNNPSQLSFCLSSSVLIKSHVNSKLNLGPLTRGFCEEYNYYKTVSVLQEFHLDQLYNFHHLSSDVSVMNLFLYFLFFQDLYNILSSVLQFNAIVPLNEYRHHGLCRERFFQVGFVFLYSN